MLLDDPDELQEYIIKSKDKYVHCENLSPPCYPNDDIPQDTVPMVGGIYGELGRSGDSAAVLQ